MLKHDDLDTIHSNLFELARMINYKSSDPYIKSMYQYIVNPIAWVVTEQAVRASKNIEDSKNSSQAVQQLKAKIAAIVKETDAACDGDCDCGEILNDLVANLRQLSAV